MRSIEFLIFVRVMDTPVFYHESFANLIITMSKLDIIGIKHHMIAPTLVMQGMGMNTSWIPLPVMGLYAEFIEITSARGVDDVEGP